MNTARLSSLLLCVACAVAALVALFAPTPAVAVPQTRAPVLREAAPQETDAVLYPPQRIALHFDHSRHAKLGTGCVYCHDSATRSRVVGDRLLPPPARCDACHGSNHEQPEHVQPGVGAASECSYCHLARSGGSPNDVERTVMPPANLRFDHAVHTSRGIPCTRCHANVERGALATTSNLPRMKDCTTCHAAGGTAKDACDVCHLTTVGGRLKTRFASGSLLPGSFMRSAEHGPDWTFRHKVVAGADSAACATCHSEEECVECHDGRVRPRQVHPNDWLDMHAVAARQDEQSCGSCHRASSFCITCHQRAGVAMSGPAGNAAARGRFHPPRSVWTDPPRTASHHAWEAERNITACVSCHTERDCATCHATSARGGQGGLSPHPAGFSASCRNAFTKNPRPCLFCHDSADPRLASCRCNAVTRSLADFVGQPVQLSPSPWPFAEHGRESKQNQPTGPQCACAGVRPVGIAMGYCGSTDLQPRRPRVKELVRYLLDNMYLDFQGEISVEKVREFLREDDTREARRLLAKIIEEKGVDDLLITLADCLKEHIRSGISDDKVREQLQLYSDS